MRRGQGRGDRRDGGCPGRGSFNQHEQAGCHPSMSALPPLLANLERFEETCFAASLTSLAGIPRLRECVIMGWRGIVAASTACKAENGTEDGKSGALGQSDPRLKQDVPPSACPDGDGHLAAAHHPVAWHVRQVRASAGHQAG